MQNVLQLPDLAPGTVWLHAAKAGHFKTSFLLNLAYRYIREGKNVLFCTFDRPGASILRDLTLIHRTDPKFPDQMALEDVQADLVRGQYGRCQFFNSVDEFPTPTVLLESARTGTAEGQDLILVELLGIFPVALSHMVIDLKRMAKLQNAVVVATTKPVDAWGVDAPQEVLDVADIFTTAALDHDARVLNLQWVKPAMGEARLPVDFVHGVIPLA